MRINNPVIRGFNPDPSICRVGEDFYLVTSSFEYFPGLPIYHSKNLVDWELVNHAINRSTQIKLSTEHPNANGLYAPTIRFIDGIFYIVCTNVTGITGEGGNFLISTDDILAEWSDPVWLDTPGIDPSLFQDDDGKIYYQGTDKIIYNREINLTTGELGPRIDIWEGTGARDIEAPHIYKNDGYYYLIVAEGGTTYEHMVSIARSKSIEGPYQGYSDNPVLTNRSLALNIRAVGHADLVQDKEGNWWAVCLGIRTLPGFPPKHILGREVSLIPITWPSKNWPVFGQDGTLPSIIETTLPAACKLCNVENHSLDFHDKHWTYLYEKSNHLIKADQKGDRLFIYANSQKLSSQQPMAWIGRRQEEFRFKANVTLDITNLSEQQEVGLTVFLNAKHHYEIIVKREEDNRYAFIRRQIGTLIAESPKTPVLGNHIELQIVGTPEVYAFYFNDEAKQQVKIGEGEVRYLSTEVGGAFTGNFIAIYSCKEEDDLSEPIIVESFHYKNKEELA